MHFSIHNKQLDFGEEAHKIVKEKNINLNEIGEKNYLFK